VVFEWISERFSWIPFYVVLAVLMGFKFKWKLLIILPFAGLLIFFADQISVHFFKDVFLRLRPCHNPTIADLVHIVNDHCGGKYGFVSSHAANTFALAVFVGLVLKNHFKWMLSFMLVWATIVSYSRIYLGVHYPGDVLGGALLGASIGFVIWRALCYCNKFFNLNLTL
jgi:undecaprenyl-diphosphatase